MTRVLFISRTFPIEPEKDQHGVFKRMRMFLDAIQDRVDELDILFYVHFETDISAAACKQIEDKLCRLWNIRCKLFLLHLARPFLGQATPWNRYGAGMFSVSRQLGALPYVGAEQSDGFAQYLRERHPDWILAHRLPVMLPILQAKDRFDLQLPPIFFDMDDVEHQTFYRDAFQPPRWRWKFLNVLQIPALIRFEKRAVRSTVRSFVCSDKDSLELSVNWRLPAHRIKTIHNAVDLPIADQTLSTGQEQSVLFLGLYSYPPNANAAEHLIQQIWPKIRSEMPQAQLIIAGHLPHFVPSYANPPTGVKFTGFVDDLAALYRSTRVVCCPVLAGGGTRVKIIEAAAFAKPIVSTTIGAEGLCFVNREEILLCDDPNAFAAAVLHLLRNDVDCRRLGRAARAKAEALYERGSVMRTIWQEIQEGLQQTTAHMGTNPRPQEAR